MQEKEVTANMNTVCGLFGRSKQGYYQHRSIIKKQQVLVDDIILAVKRIRAAQPFIGVRKLQYMLVESGINVGRDKLFSTLRAHNMLSQVYRRRCYTSIGRRSKYPNLVKLMGTAQRVGEIIASDITYLRTQKGFVFLSLTSDHYSDSILGYSLQKDLGAQGPALALKQAMKKLRQVRTSKHVPSGIHHSDHGCQYTSNRFQRALRKYSYLTSMTGAGKCYDNAKAERINGILKHELGLKRNFRDFDDASRYVKDAIRIYNEDRIIITQNYHTPDEILKAA